MPMHLSLFIPILPSPIFWFAHPIFLTSLRQYIYTSPITHPPLVSPMMPPVRNLGVTFDPHLSFSNHISNRSCFRHIRDLRRILPMLDSKTASTIATSSVHSKL